MKPRRAKFRYWSASCILVTDEHPRTLQIAAILSTGIRVALSFVKMARNETSTAGPGTRDDRLERCSSHVDEFQMSAGCPKE
jgi:hypothetical protein